jgi:hypothetical protein
MRRALTLTLGVLLLVLASAPVEAGDKPSPPQSQAFGKSLAEWLVSYFTWALGGDQTNPDGRVLFLPIPASEPVSGSGTPDDPLVLVGHADVTVKPGTPFVLPIAVFIGELYGPDVDVPFNPDPEVPESVFEGTDILITLDGQPIIDSTTEDKFRYYVPPQYFEEPIFYDQPTSSGSIAAVFVQGFVFVHPPLSKGTHTLTLRSSLILPAGVYPNVPDGFGFVYENSWTITVEP